MLDNIVLIKIGGETARKMPQSLLWQLGALARQHQLIIVHGAGSDITEAAVAAGITTRRVDGLRVTPPAVLKIAQKIINQQVQPNLCAQLATLGIHPHVLDGGVTATQLNAAKYGLVGAVGAISCTALQSQLAETGALLIGPLLPSSDGQLLNVNADDVAMALARKLGVQQLHFVTDVPGVLDDQGAVVKQLTPVKMQTLTANHVISGGMTVKLRAGLAVAAQGTRVTIGALYGAGTQLTANQEEQ
ncbi:acetylglutamate kinase [Lacticaseibacillus hulanensis]|uniref:acetylglutamate kinase n=1 Tax=Lacticaseibacillus hulanensis TaxID=2493111 RepID=UPI000FDCCB59|nr:acetylglutamate kinase [Lacticaseibacillus hulanensis]